MTEEMAENRSLWHMKIKAGPLLQGGGPSLSERWGGEPIIYINSVDNIQVLLFYNRI